MHINFKQFILVLILLIQPSSAFAYIDPGTGSIILQILLGALAAGLTFIKIYWLKIKNFFNFKKKSQKK